MQWLLREREEAIVAGGVYPRIPSYYFMDPLFIGMAKRIDYSSPWSEKAKHFFVSWGSAVTGPPIIDVDYIFVPANVNENHWILMVFAVKAWGVMVLDPMQDNAQYAEEEECMVPTHLTF